MIQSHQDMQTSPLRLSAVILLRYLIITAVLLNLSVAGIHDGTAFVMIMALLYVASIPYGLRFAAAHRCAIILFVFECAVLAGVIFKTGGVGSKYWMLWPVVILSAGVTVPFIQSVRLAMASVLIYLMVAVAHQNITLLAAGGADLSAEWMTGTQLLGLRGIACLFFGALAGEIAAFRQRPMSPDVLDASLVDQRCAFRRERERLLNTIADGIRNPVTAITSAAHLLRKIDSGSPHKGDDPLEKQREMVFDSLLQEASRLDRLIEAFIMESRISPDSIEEVFRTLKAQEKSEPKEETLPLNLP